MTVDSVISEFKVKESKSKKGRYDDLDSDGEKEVEEEDELDEQDEIDEAMNKARTTYSRKMGTLRLIPTAEYERTSKEPIHTRPNLGATHCQRSDTNQT